MCTVRIEMEFNEMFLPLFQAIKTKFCQIDSFCLCRVTLDVVFLRLGNRFFSPKKE